MMVNRGTASLRAQAVRDEEGGWPARGWRPDDDCGLRPSKMLIRPLIPPAAATALLIQLLAFNNTHGPPTPSVIPLIQAINAINSQAPSRDHHSRSSSVVRLLARPMNNTPVSPAEA